MRKVNCILQQFVVVQECRYVIWGITLEKYYMCLFCWNLLDFWLMWHHLMSYFFHRHFDVTAYSTSDFVLLQELSFIQRPHVSLFQHLTSKLEAWVRYWWFANTSQQAFFHRTRSSQRSIPQSGFCPGLNHLLYSVWLSNCAHGWATT